jgi:hypothetical protein
MADTLIQPDVDGESAGYVFSYYRIVLISLSAIGLRL